MGGKLPMFLAIKEEKKEKSGGTLLCRKQILSNTIKKMKSKNLSN